MIREKEEGEGLFGGLDCRMYKVKKKLIKSEEAQQL